MHLTNRIILIIFLIFSSFSSVFCQDDNLTNPMIDSLKRQLLLVSDSVKVDVLNKIAYNFYYYNNDSTDEFAMEAVNLAKQLNYTKGLSEAQRMMGISYQLVNNVGESIKWLYQALESAESINYAQGIGDNLNSIGILYNSIEDWEEAISYYNSSIDYQKVAGNRLREGILYTNLGVVFLSINQLDSSDYYFRKSQTIIDSIADKRWMSMVYSQYGGLFIKQRKLKKAEEYSNLAIDLSKETGQTFHLRKSYQNLAEIYLLQKKYGLCNQFADLALNISNQIGSYKYMIEAYKVKYRLFAEMGQFRNALFFSEKYASYIDSLRKDQIHNEAALLSYQMDLMKKEQENIILRNEKEIQEVQNQIKNTVIERQTIIVIGITIILVLVSILAFIFFRLRQRERESNEELMQTNTTLEEQKEELSATVQMVEHLNAQLQAQNNTLNKIAIVSITDLEGNIVSANDNFCEVTGYSREELLGHNHNILNSGEHPDEIFTELWNTIRNGNTWRGELKNKTKSGSYFWADTAIAPIFDDEGKPKQFFSLQFDITRRKNYLQDLALKGQELEESNKLKDKLLSIVSHDIRSPLNSLRGTLDLFLRGAISNEELHMLSQNLVNKLDVTYNLLENLLNWTKSQMQGMKVSKKEINLKTIAESCIKLLSPLAEKKLVTINNKIQEPYHAFADQEMVKLILRNLLSNAIKFTAAGNEIELDAKIEDQNTLISVKDNGMGISQENQDKLFKMENFTTSGTSNETGMGLGLLLCKDFVEKNGGLIWFESEQGKGSTFYFTLPLEEKVTS